MAHINLTATTILVHFKTTSSTPISSRIKWKEQVLAASASAVYNLFSIGSAGDDAGKRDGWQPVIVTDKDEIWFSAGDGGYFNMVVLEA